MIRTNVMYPRFLDEYLVMKKEISMLIKELPWGVMSSQ